MRKDFNDCVELFETEKIKEFVKTALKQAPKKFWKDPCSRTGKHHPPEDQVEGGIVVHSRKAVRVAIDLFRFYNINDRLTQEKIIAACILHDINKNGNPWGPSTDYEHGHIAGDELRDIKVSGELANSDKDLVDIIELVENHMGIWNKPNPTPALIIGKKVTEKDIWHNIMQLSDYWGSRKWCPFVIDNIEL